MPNKPLTAIIVGVGHRALVYASYAKHHPDELQIVGAADPDKGRLQDAVDAYGLAPEQTWDSAEALAADGPPKADAVINGTMDHQHVDTSLPLLEAGYDMLLEKPFATDEDEMWRLVECARRNDRKVMICHVLRYAPFYRAIREKVAAGEIGRIMSVQAIEHVSYHHMAMGYVRGKWHREDECHSTMLMAKSCHDLDLITWMKSGIAPLRVSSFGGRMFFRRECAPENSGEMCLVDCPIEQECDYSAYKHYINHPKRWSFYVWDYGDKFDYPKDMTVEQKIERLKDPKNPFGRCVWKMDNDVVDHQSVAIEFEDGATGTLNMVGGTAKPQRAIRLIGTHGEIEGVFDESRFVVRHIDARPGHETSEVETDLKVSGDMTGATGGHGGGDLRLVGDFVQFVRGGDPSISTTSLDDSVNGHLLGFRADASRREGVVKDMEWRV